MTRLVERFIFLTWKHIVYLHLKLPPKRDWFADLLMYVIQFLEKIGQQVISSSHRQPVERCQEFFRALANGQCLMDTKQNTEVAR